jgi:hypothetical protein
MDRTCESLLALLLVYGVFNPTRARVQMPAKATFCLPRVRSPAGAAVRREKRDPPRPSASPENVGTRQRHSVRCSETTQARVPGTRKIWGPGGAGSGCR